MSYIITISGHPQGEGDALREVEAEAAETVLKLGPKLAKLAPGTTVTVTVDRTFTATEVEVFSADPKPDET